MMQIVPKWRVTVQLPGRAIEIWLSDNFIGNVQRKVAEIDWTRDGLEQPVSVHIERETRPFAQTGVVMTHTGEKA